MRRLLVGAAISIVVSAWSPRARVRGDRDVGRHLHAPRRRRALGRPERRAGSRRARRGPLGPAGGARLDSGRAHSLPAPGPTGCSRLRRCHRRRPARGHRRQGAARGTFTARPGNARGLVARGLYQRSGGVEAVVDDPYGPARLVDLESGSVVPSTPRAPFAIGSGFATRAPTTGTATFDPKTARIDGRSTDAPPRAPVRGAVQERLGHAGRHAVASLRGGEARGCCVCARLGADRSGLPARAVGVLLRHGLAVLVYDKRGIGQSGGSYPGDSPTAAAIDTLARDAAAAARFLAAQPEIDRARVGLTGQSQAGWIAPLAASREPAIRFLVLFSGPAVTADENDIYQDLAGEGEHLASSPTRRSMRRCSSAGRAASTRSPRSGS